MANARPSTMAQVAVKYTLRTPLRGKVKGNAISHYQDTLEQACRRGIITLNDEGKILEVLNKDANIIIPQGMGPEDVFALTPADVPKD